MQSESEFLEDSFTGSGFSAYEEYSEDFSDNDDWLDSKDNSLNDFEDDAIYDEAFENEFFDGDDFPQEENVDTSFNDGFDEL